MTSPKERSGATFRAYPAPQSNKNQSSELQQWEILLAGDFNEEHTELLKAILEVPKNSQGTIYIDSNGGSVYTSLAISSLIRIRKLRATAIVLGECSSAALLPFATCEQRYVTPYTTHLFHPMKWESEENIRLEEAAEWTRHFKSMETSFEKLLAELLKLAPETLQQWSSPGRFVSGQELIDRGIASMLDPFEGFANHCATK